MLVIMDINELKKGYTKDLKFLKYVYNNKKQALKKYFFKKLKKIYGNSA